MSSSLSFVRKRVLSCMLWERKNILSVQSSSCQEKSAFPYPCLGCMIGPSLPGTFPTECPVSSFKPRTNWDGRSSCITLFLEQLPAKSISLPFLLLLVTKSCLTLVTPWTIACQAPLSVGFPSREYWSGLSFSSPGDLPYSEIKSTSPALQVDF